MTKELFARLQRDYADTWQSLLEIDAKFRAHSHQLYLVGGAVRNLVLGVPLKDFDLASDAIPEQIIRLFHNVIPTGIQHGTVTLVYRKQHFEITTFRLDGAYTDSRRPDSVSFTPSILEDLKRRDFTINAMALDLSQNKLIDPHDGRKDLIRRLIRTVGIAQERFNEDGLRIMRALRFAAQLGFSIETATWQAMEMRLERLGKVSVERFRDELLKTLDSSLPSRGLFLMRRLGALELFLSGSAQLSEEAFAQSCLAVDILPSQPPELRLTAFLSCFAPASITPALKGLRLSNASIKLVELLLELLPHAYNSAWKDADLRRLAARAGRSAIHHLVASLNAQSLARDWLSYNPAEPAEPMPVTAPFENEELISVLDFIPSWAARIDNLRNLPDPACQELIRRMEQVLSLNCPLTIAELQVDGKALQAIGIPHGRQLGVILGQLLQRVLEEPELNETERLLELAAGFWKAAQQDQASGKSSS